MPSLTHLSPISHQSLTYLSPISHPTLSPICDLSLTHWQSLTHISPITHQFLTHLPSLNHLSPISHLSLTHQPSLTQLSPISHHHSLFIHPFLTYLSPISHSSLTNHSITFFCHCDNFCNKKEISRWSEFFFKIHLTFLENIFLKVRVKNYIKKLKKTYFLIFVTGVLRGCSQTTFTRRGM